MMPFDRGINDGWRGGLRRREFFESLLNCTSCLGRIQVRNSEITHGCLDVLVPKEILNRLDFRRTGEESGIGAPERVEIGMELVPRPFCDALHDPKQMLIRPPHSIRKDQLAAGIFLLAFGNRRNEVLRDWDAANVPVFRMPVHVWLVHNIQEPIFHVRVLSMGCLTIANTRLEKIVQGEPLLVVDCGGVENLDLLGIVENNWLFSELRILTLLEQTVDSVCTQENDNIVHFVKVCPIRIARPPGLSRPTVFPQFGRLSA
jgi:hypothetical protein